MFNPWGLLFVALGALLIYVGIQGTQNNLYTFFTGNRPTAQNNTPFAPFNETETNKTEPKVTSA